MKRLSAITLLLSVVALLAVAAGSASAACVPPYCPAPTAATGAATNITDTSANLVGAVSAAGAGNASWQIQLGTSPGSYTVLVASGSTPAGQVSGTATGLQPNTTYYWRVTASSLGGVAYGQEASFTTASTPAPPPPDNGNNDNGNGTGDQGGDQGGNGVPSTNPSEPTARQTQAARKDAGQQLGAPARPDRSFDVAQALVFVPTAGGGKKRDQDTPTVTGKTARLDPSSVSDGNAQNFLAVSCPNVGCTASFEMKVTYVDAKGKKHTVTLEPQSLDVSNGDTKILQLKLPKAVRKALLRGDSVKLKVGMTVDQAGGGTLGSSTKTYTLKTSKPKKSHHKSHHKSKHLGYAHGA